MSARGAGGLLLRQAKAEWPLLAVLALLVFVSAFIAAAVPRAFTVVADKALYAAVHDAPVGADEVTARSTNDLPLAQLDAIDAQLEDRMPDPLKEVLGERAVGVTSARYQALRPGSGEPFRPRPYAWLTLRYQSGLLDRVRWIEGSAPAMAVPPTAGAPAQLEVALAAGSAERLDMRVGDRIQLDFVDEPIGGGRPLVVRVSGLFQPLDRADRAWIYEPSVLSPGVELTASGETLAEYGAALIAEQQVPALQDAAPVLSFDWHYPVRANALNSGNASPVLTGLEQTLAVGVSLDLGRGLRPVMGVPPSVTLTSGLLEQLDDYAAQAATAEAVSSLVLAGLFAVALLVLALAAHVSVQRRGPALSLGRGRGASSGQVAGALAVETALVAVPAAVVGYGAAVAVVRSRSSTWSTVLVAVLLIASVASVCLSGWMTHRSGGVVRLSRRFAVPASKRRLVIEVMIVGLALAGLGLLRRRGLESSTSGADPFLAVVPVLLALAVGVLALRAYPWLMRALLRIFSGRAGPVAFVSFSQGARQSLASMLPMAVLLLGLGFAVFASTVRTTIDQGQTMAAWGEVGADYRVSTDGVLLPEEVDALAAIDGVMAAAPAVAPTGSVAFDAQGRPLPVRFLAIDPELFEDVVAAAPPGVVAGDDLAALGTPVGAGDGVLPALVSPEVADVADGGQVRVVVGSGLGELAVGVQGVAETFPTDGGGAFVVVDLREFQALRVVPQRPDELFIDAPPGAAETLAQTTESLGGTVVLDDRRAFRAAMARTPLVEGTTAAFRRGVAAAAGYCLLATLFALVLSARSREQVLAILRTLGMNRRQALAVAALELGPLFGVVVLSGWAVGLVLPHLLVPAIDLSSFTGGLVAPPVRVDLLAVGLLGLGLVAIVAVAIAVTLTLGARRRLGQPL